MQKLVTEYCWDEIWNRPGLGRRERSILNLGMISVLNRQHELRGHVRGALNNGLTKEEIQEIFLQVAIYCGVPAAIDSFPRRPGSARRRSEMMPAERFAPPAPDGIVSR